MKIGKLTAKKVIIVTTALLVFYFLLKLVTAFFGVSRIALEPSPLVERGNYSAKSDILSQEGSFQDNIPLPGGKGTAPVIPSETSKKLVIYEANISLVVKSVEDTIDKIGKFIEEKNGYMVTENLNYPQEQARGFLVVRIPSSTFNDAIKFIKEAAVKVVSEDKRGQDVTEEYVDIGARLQSLEASRDQFTKIMEQAKTIDEILRVQRELTNINSQIESLRGRIQYLEKSAQMAKITIYLATDEGELPIAPSEKWRPNIVFKKAMRSLLSVFKDISYLLIWLVVFSILWVPVVILVYFIWRHFKKR